MNIELPPIEPVTTPPPSSIRPKRRLSRGKKIAFICSATLLLVIGAVIGSIAYSNYWYTENLKPLSMQQKRIRLTIAQGSGVGDIGKQLQSEGVIKSARAFGWYVDRTGNKQKLQAGTYLFSPTESVQQIVEKLIGGKIDQMNITLVPGRRLDQIRDSLIKAGFDEKQLDTALAKKYDHPLFAEKPDGADLEGYIFPETYQISSETTPEQFLTHTFDIFYQQLQEAGLIDKIHAQGLSLYQGITIASIVQKETGNVSDQGMVAQVFLKRYKIGMPLGSDVTFIYASQKAGVPDDLNIDSPYNTRKYPGLPPGPIANFNMTALQSVANPAPTDYLYFVAGDDGKTYFSHTEQEHQDLTRQHCTKLCQ